MVTQGWLHVLVRQAHRQQTQALALLGAAGQALQFVEWTVGVIEAVNAPVPGQGDVMTGVQQQLVALLEQVPGRHPLPGDQVARLAEEQIQQPRLIGLQPAADAGAHPVPAVEDRAIDFGKHDNLSIDNEIDYCLRKIKKQATR
ncbi:hypothetical protein FQZ97_1042470 [compost metagenome]